MQTTISQQQQLLESLTTLFESFLRRDVHNDAFAEKGKRVFQERVAYFVERNLPVEFVLPAFPFKSPNPQNVLGPLPDFGEELVLRSLANLAVKIRELYAPGARINIVSDGRVFADLAGITPATMEAYFTQLQRPCADTDIAFYTLKDLLGENQDESTDRVPLQTLLREFAPCPPPAAAMLDLLDSDTMRFYLGMKRYLATDLLWPCDYSQKRIKKQCAFIAREAIRRNLAFNALIRARFPHHIRLSVHPQTNAGEKFAFNLYASACCTGSTKADTAVLFWGTPWHNVVVVHLDGSISVMKRAKAELLPNVFLVRNSADQPSHFQEKINDNS